MVLTFDREFPKMAGTAFQERVIEVHAVGEEAVVSKEVRIFEEVVIRRRARDRVEIVRDSLRETRAEVEEIAAAPGEASRS